MLKSLFRAVSKKILKENQNERRNQKARDSRDLDHPGSRTMLGLVIVERGTRLGILMKAHKQERKYFEHWKLGTQETEYSLQTK